MKLLVTGANGLLGMNLSLEARRDHEVVGVDRGGLTSPPFPLIQADLLDAGAIEQTLSVTGAEAVIHCAALADIDACERDPAQARLINTDLPERIAGSCARAGIRMVHISTDAVFDGNASGAYSEADAPHPTSVYARTKQDAETAVLKAYPAAIVARVNFYGWSVSGTRSLGEFFVGNLRARKPVRGFTDVTFCPMLVNELARTLLAMLHARLQGLFHCVGPEPMTKYEFGVSIARKFGFDEGLIHATSVDSAGLGAQRGHNLHLSVHKLSTALGRKLPSFSTGLDEFFTQYSEGFPQQLRGYQQLAAAPSRDVAVDKDSAAAPLE